MAKFLLEIRRPGWSEGQWMAAGSRINTRKEAAAAAEKRERAGWQARITRLAPSPHIDYTTGQLRERGTNTVVYVTPDPARATASENRS